MTSQAHEAEYLSSKQAGEMQWDEFVNIGKCGSV